MQILEVWIFAGLIHLIWIDFIRTMIHLCISYTLYCTGLLLFQLLTSSQLNLSSLFIYKVLLIVFHISAEHFLNVANITTMALLHTPLSELNRNVGSASSGHGLSVTAWMQNLLYWHRDARTTPLIEISHLPMTIFACVSHSATSVSNRNCFITR